MSIEQVEKTYNKQIFFRKSVERVENWQSTGRKQVENRQRINRERVENGQRTGREQEGDRQRKCTEWVENRQRMGRVQEEIMKLGILAKQQTKAEKMANFKETLAVYEFVPNFLH